MLQRALEREVEKEGSSGLSGVEAGGVVEAEWRRATMQTVVVGGTTTVVPSGLEDEDDHE
jgi:hypothetical protein